MFVVVYTLVALHSPSLIIWLYVRCELITILCSRASVAGALDSFFIYRNKRTNVKTNKFNPLKTKRRPLYLKTQSVPRCKHFSSRL